MIWYKEFFDKWYFDLYQESPRFKKDYIEKENAFIRRVLDLPKGSKILDLCSGYGRHSVLLAKHGYKVTAFDLNKKALNLLKCKAKENNLDIEIIEGDMRKIPFNNRFDGVINIFTSFGYFENDRENLKVLEEIRKSLKDNGKFLLDIRNKNWVLKNSFSQNHYQTKSFSISENRIFDKKNNQEIVNLIIKDKNKKAYSSKYITKLYSLNEIEKMLKLANLRITKIYGDTTIGSSYNKERSKRLVVLCNK